MSMTINKHGDTVSSHHGMVCSVCHQRVGDAVQSLVSHAKNGAIVCHYCASRSVCGHFAYRNYWWAEDDYGCAGCDNDLPPDRGQQ